MNKTLIIQILLFTLAILSLCFNIEELSPILFTSYMLLFLLSCGLEDNKPIIDKNYLIEDEKKDEKTT